MAGYGNGNKIPIGHEIFGKEAAKITKRFVKPCASKPLRTFDMILSQLLLVAIKDSRSNRNSFFYLVATELDTVSPVLSFRLSKINLGTHSGPK